MLQALNTGIELSAKFNTFSDDSRLRSNFQREFPCGTPDEKHCEPLFTALTDFYQKTSTSFNYYETAEPLICYFCKGVYDA